ncbi:MAG: Gfo/Idh/MocA family protein [Chloroflexota bacterium]
MTTTLRWGILSTANIATEKVIPGIRRAARCEIVAIASRESGTAARVAERLSIPRSHGSYEALLADPDVDAVYIPLPNHLHLEWTLAAAAAGKHVLCEKPIALTAADAERMVDACERAGVRLMEAFMYRHHPSWVALRELVVSGRIGRLEAIQTWFGFYNDDPSNIRNVREFGGGALYDVGCYCINLSRMLFGGEPTRVEASIVRDGGDGVDILTAGLLEFESGIASFGCSIRTETDQRVNVYGSEGRLSIGIPFNIPTDHPTEIYLTKGGDPPVAPATETFRFETKDPYAAQAEAFAAAILDELPTPVPPSDAVANMRVIERVFAAAEAGHPAPA